MFWDYCSKNAKEKFVEIIAKNLVVQRFCKYTIVTTLLVLIFFFFFFSLRDWLLEVILPLKKFFFGCPLQYHILCLCLFAFNMLLLELVFDYYGWFVDLFVLNTLKPT